PTKGRCPLEPRQGRSPWNPLLWFGDGRGGLCRRRCTGDRRCNGGGTGPPSHLRTKVEGSKGFALGGVPRGSAPWWAWAAKRTKGAKPLAFPRFARLTGPPRASTSGGMLRRFEALLDPTAPAPDAP